MKFVLRVPKEQAAYIYQLLESYDGIATYSTLDNEKAFPFRDIAIIPAPDLVSSVKIMIENITREIPCVVKEE